MPDSCDVAIVGGGPAGCSLALALRGSAQAVALLERRPAGRGRAGAARPIALSHASRLILERLGVWPHLPVTPIETILVSRQGFGRTRLDAVDAGVPALGYVVEYARLAQALKEQVLAAGIRVTFDAHDPSIERDGNGLRLRCGQSATDLAARCVVHAEGSAQSVDKDYGQSALIALIAAEPVARTAAFERFTDQGPLALLPMDGRYALVWSMPPERASRLADVDAAQFLRELQAATGNRAGRLLGVEARGQVRLGLRVRTSRIAHREAYIGNAAQTLHPVAGQGLNLALRDAWDLGLLLRDAADPGDASLLRRFAAARKLDAFTTIMVTDLLAGRFLAATPLGDAARGALMTALDVLSPARRFFARRMIFGPSAIP